MEQQPESALSQHRDVPPYVGPALLCPSALLYLHRGRANHFMLKDNSPFIAELITLCLIARADVKRIIYEGQRDDDTAELV